MTALLDVNVLIALGWPNHVQHQAARRWFAESAGRGWATTPVTEIGFVRISSNRSVMQVSTTPAVAIALLGQLATLPGHTFWPDSIRLVVGESDPERIASHRHVTDAHLVALAALHGGSLVTFDAALADSARGGVVSLLSTG